MAGIVELQWKFDASKLNEAIALRAQHQGKRVRTFAQIVNTALFSVALKAQKYTKAATPATIDASMNVTVNFVINKMGKRVPKRKPGTYSYGPGTYETSTSLAKLIVLARANISKQGRATGKSFYNEKTNDRWQLTPEELKGKGTIESIMFNMVAARHSSTGLLKAGWKPAIDTLRPLIARNDIGGAGSTGERFSYNENSERLGMAIPAIEGWYVKGTIENHVGGGGTKLDAIQREALIKYGAIPLQRALREETATMLAKVQEYIAKDAADFNRSMR